MKRMILALVLANSAWAAGRFTSIFQEADERRNNIDRMQHASSRRIDDIIQKNKQDEREHYQARNQKNTAILNAVVHSFVQLQNSTIRQTDFKLVISASTRQYEEFLREIAVGVKEGVIADRILLIYAQSNLEALQGISTASTSVSLSTISVAESTQRLPFAQLTVS